MLAANRAIVRTIGTVKCVGAKRHDMQVDSADKNTVKTTETVFAILNALQDLDGAGVTELATHLGLAKSTMHRHLSTLAQTGYVVKEDDMYHISLRFLNLGEYAKNRKQAYILAESKVSELAKETEERVQFIVEEHGQAIYVHRAIGARAVETDPGIGNEVPVHAIAAGKAILAHLPGKNVSRIIERHGLPTLTPNTITDTEELFDRLEMIREQGYSVNDQEHITGLKAVGVPIQEPDGTVIGAFSISGPAHRMKGAWFKEELPDLLLGTANELELNIAHANT